MITFSLDNTDVIRTVATIKRMRDRYTNAINTAIASAVINVESDAKLNITKNKAIDTGMARAKILSNHNKNQMTGTVRSATKYGAVIEFGRKPGRFPPVRPLRLWVRRKGIAKGRAVNSVAFLIARKIARKGIVPRPYLHPAFDKQLPKFRTRVKDEIQKASRE